MVGLMVSLVRGLPVPRNINRRLTFIHGCSIIKHMSDAILTPNKFALIVENIVKDKKISYIDAILEYCKDNEIDPSNTRSMINKTLKEKIAYEAQNLNMLKEKVAKLPF